MSPAATPSGKSPVRKSALAAKVNGTAGCRGVEVNGYGAGVGICGGEVGFAVPVEVGHDDPKGRAAGGGQDGEFRRKTKCGRVYCYS